MPIRHERCTRGTMADRVQLKKRGDWSFEVVMGGLGPVNASCDDGGRTRLVVGRLETADF